MGFFRLLLRPRWRLFSSGWLRWASDRIVADQPGASARCPLQAGPRHACRHLGMFFDVAVFPFATPDSYLDDDWKRAPGAVRLRCADFAIAKGYLWPFVMACLRRAAVVAAFVVAVSVGL